MEKGLFILAAVFIFLSSCSSSGFEKDGRRMARLICRQQQLERQVMNGNETVRAELQKVKEERDKLKEELSEKYKDFVNDEKMRKRANEIQEEELAKCK